MLRNGELLDYWTTYSEEYGFAKEVRYLWPTNEFVTQCRLGSTGILEFCDEKRNTIATLGEDHGEGNYMFQYATNYGCFAVYKNTFHEIAYCLNSDQKVSWIS